MRTRRSFLTVMSLLPAALASPAMAFEFQPYDAAAVQKAIASGKPVVVHVNAWWRLQCHAQASILDGLKSATKGQLLPRRQVLRATGSCPSRPA